MDDVIGKSVFEDWQEIEDLFPARAAMSPQSFITKGFSARSAKRRLSAVMSNSGASALAARIDQMDTARLKAMRSFAAVNLEQAANGFRTTIVVNITVPVLFLTVINQNFSGNWSSQFLKAHEEGVLGWLLLTALGVSIFYLLFLVTFSLAQLNQARDIRHIIDLKAAERGIYFGLEDVDGFS